VLLPWLISDQLVGVKCSQVLSSVSPPIYPEFGQWISAFALTIAIELAVAWLVIRFGSKHSSKFVGGKLIPFSWLVIVANLSTHPLVYLGIPRFAYQAGWTYGGFLFAAEAFAFMVETLIYAGIGSLKLGRAVQLSALANGSSWILGIFLGL
jgi:hypothetical protein